MRVHNTKTQDIVFRPCLQEAIDSAGFLKPLGLWYGVDGDWLEWCREEQPDWIHPFNFELDVDLSKMALLSSFEDVKKFTEKYGESRHNILSVVNWMRVAEEYSGIEIAPYVFEARLERSTLWYYGWDCASGCIWKEDAIKRIIRRS